jgi:uncharacterized protein (UPF0332 family)
MRRAQESLASAKADAAAGRYNCAANRAYYAAFQAAIAALIHTDIAPDGGQWQHRFVNGQFSGKLVRRRKLLDKAFPAMMDDLFRMRVVGDYEPANVARRDASRGSVNAGRIVEGVQSMMTTTGLREASAEYETAVKEGTARGGLAELQAHEMQQRILSTHPEARFELRRIGPRDYRLNVFMSPPSLGHLSRTLRSMTADILIDNDLWIVAIPHDIAGLDEG